MVKHVKPVYFYLFVNILFIFKYMGRTAYNPLYGVVGFLLVLGVLFAAHRLVSRKERLARPLLFASVALVVAAICLMLCRIDPLSVNVDRWSATTYFLDGLFAGTYPYGIHTHVCETNFPSPFPLWHYLNIPFWTAGDVGYGLIAILLLTLATLWWYYRSDRNEDSRHDTNEWSRTLLFTLLLMASPAYWWEVAVRSDGLSNALLVFCVILFMEKKKLSFQYHWVATAVICGMMASTRLSAIIPLALYLARSFFSNISFRQPAALAIIALVVFLFFSPYIFWDTESWVFFQRNPFMSQSSTGNAWILLAMMALAFWLAFHYKDFKGYTLNTTCFIFTFFLVSLLYNHFAYHNDIAAFEDADFDISYFTLTMPYCLFSMGEEQSKRSIPQWFKR